MRGMVIMRGTVICAGLIVSVATTASASSELTDHQTVLAMAVDTAMFAADHCPGLHIIDGAIFANMQSAGVTKEQALGPERKNAMLLGEMNSKDGYVKSPSEFCQRVWQMLGPSPSFVKHQLQEKG